MPNLYLKYVRDKDDNFVIFNKMNHSVAHVDFKPFMGNIKTAGFLGINRISGKVLCGGRSESLNIDSIPDDDSQFFTDFFRHKKLCHILGNSGLVFATNLTIDDFGHFDLEMISNCGNLTDITCL